MSAAMCMPMYSQPSKCSRTISRCGNRRWRISRDIFTMGARPIASLNSLRFGNLENKRTQHLLKGIVKGISHYGNCFGVPTVAGEVYFDDCYQVNPLVNAMSVGIVRVGETISATSEGVGNPIYIVGASTGKDGIHGATFASEDLVKMQKIKFHRYKLVIRLQKTFVRSN